MTRIFGILIAVLFLSVGQTASAQYSNELLKRAQDGDAEAQRTLGLIHKNGQDVIQDYAEAVKWFLRAAEQGDALAQGNLGIAYTNGEGAVQDHTEAVKWFRRAAEQGESQSQGLLGVAYGIGRGVTQDVVYSHMWFNISLSLGNDIGKKGRDMIATQMTPEQIVEAQKMARECVRKEYKDC